MPVSYAEALVTLAASLDRLNAAVAAGEVPESALGGILLQLETAGAKHTALRSAVLARFDAADAHDSDGYQNSSSWLRDKAGMTHPAARGQVKQMRTLRDRPLLAGAMTEGWLHDSCASSIIKWTKPLPVVEKTAADEILLGALNAGASLDDLHLLATAIVETWKSQRPDPDDDPDDGFGDRGLILDTTMDGAGRLTGDLTPRAAAALGAVLESLGKRCGKEDTRTEAQRLHDALERACDMLISAGMLPRRAGSSTRADVHIPIGELLQMDGAAALEDAWLRAKSGEPGWLLGDEARAAACDALIVPIVTAAPDWAVAAEMIYLVLDAVNAHGTVSADEADGVVPAAYRNRVGASNSGGAADGSRTDVSRLLLPAGEWDRLLHGLGKLAIRFVSGPGAIASVLRTGLLPAPFNTKSVPIDIGFSEHIPEAIRRGVIVRAGGHCEWPGGCDRPASRCDVHHVKHKKDGGPTSVSENALFCDFHHDVCVHRWGWEVELRADGVIVATSPDGQVIEGHPPPGQSPRHGPPANGPPRRRAA
ncbi:MAG TPA: DUF222 domain-containing protein [Trebonia sp.]|jgi:hypothetical protein